MTKSVPKRGPFSSRRLLTLDQFIQQSLAFGYVVVTPKNAWVSANGFSAMYARITRRYITRRYIAEEMLTPVLDLANMTARNPGQGAFTRLVERLGDEYPFLHLFVEQTHERFGTRLLKMGFVKCDPRVHGESYFLRADSGRDTAPK